MLFTNVPETLGYYALRTIVRTYSSSQHPRILQLYRENQTHLAGPENALLLLRLLVSYESPEMKDLHESMVIESEPDHPDDPQDPEFEIHDNRKEILDMYSRLFAHSSSMIIPCLSEIVDPVQLLQSPYLRKNTSRLIELSMDNFYVPDHSSSIALDELLETISKLCSSRLRRLILPDNHRHRPITEQSVNALINSNFAHTLEELILTNCSFESTSDLLRLLRGLPRLRKLSLTLVTINDITDEFIIPVDVGSLSHLEHLHIFDCSRYCCQSYRCSDLKDNTRKSEWSRLLAECLPRLQTLHLVSTMYSDRRAQDEMNWLLSVKDGLDKREKPLAYLRIPTRIEENRKIIYRMNADRICTDAVVEEISTAINIMMEGGIAGSFNAYNAIENLKYTWSVSKNKRDTKLLRKMFTVLDRLVPRYIHFLPLFELFNEVLVFAVKDSKLRRELELTPTFVSRLLTLILIRETRRFDIDAICDIFNIYKGSIPVSVFEKVFRRAINQCHRWNPDDVTLKICCFFFNMVNTYCSYDHFVVVQKIWGDVKSDLAFWCYPYGDVILSFHVGLIDREMEFFPFR